MRVVADGKSKEFARQVEFAVESLVYIYQSVGLTSYNAHETLPELVRKYEEVVTPRWHRRQLLYKVALLIVVKVWITVV